MGSRYAVTDRMARFLLRWRWLAMLLLSLSVIAFEFLEHRPGRLPLIDGDLVQEVIGIGILVPLLIGCSLSALARVHSEATVIRVTTREAERSRLARDLHDTLGQNLAFMRLTLERLSSADLTGDVTQVRQDIGQLSDIVDSTYEQVRGKLVELRAPSSTQLATALLDYARMVGRRANFSVEFHHEGQPRLLSDRTQREIIYFFREALINIEKHARARCVTVRLIWLDDGMNISVMDDGTGFDPQAGSPSGHFGLQIMRERAQEINARVTLRSKRSSGTELALWLPLDAH